MKKMKNLSVVDRCGQFYVMQIFGYANHTPTKKGALNDRVD
jgi:hypothetical protein